MRLLVAAAVLGLLLTPLVTITPAAADVTIPCTRLDAVIAAIVGEVAAPGLPLTADALSNLSSGITYRTIYANEASDEIPSDWSDAPGAQVTEVAHTAKSSDGAQQVLLATHRPTGQENLASFAAGRLSPSSGAKTTPVLSLAPCGPVPGVIGSDASVLGFAVYAGTGQAVFVMAAEHYGEWYLLRVEVTATYLFKSPDAVLHMLDTFALPAPVSSDGGGGDVPRDIHPPWPR